MVDRSGSRHGPTAGTSRRVLAALRGDIVAGALAPGERLTEASLSARYRVSRVPVREALRTLAVQGFVEMAPNRGASVARIGAEDAADLFEVRGTLEVLTAARCARRVAAGERSVPGPLRALLAEGGTEIATGRTGRLPELNTRFHLAMAEASGSASLTALLRQVSDRIEWIYAVSVTAEAVRSWAEHEGIVAAIEAGDPGEAGARARDHITRARDGFLRVQPAR